MILQPEHKGTNNNIQLIYIYIHICVTCLNKWSFQFDSCSTYIIFKECMIVLMKWFLYSTCFLALPEYQKCYQYDTNASLGTPAVPTGIPILLAILLDICFFEHPLKWKRTQDHYGYTHESLSIQIWLSWYNLVHQYDTNFLITDLTVSLHKIWPTWLIINMNTTTIVNIITHLIVQ